MFYKLTDDHEIEPMDDAKAWAHGRTKDNVTVDRTDIGKAQVSTVFLGIDHNFSKEGPPILFETMVFGDERWKDEQERYCTWDEAVAGHQTMVNRVLREVQDA